MCNWGRVYWRNKIFSKIFSKDEEKEEEVGGGREERKRRGQLGRDWAIANGFTNNDMCQNMMDSIECCFENFEPRKRFTLY